MTEGHAQAAQEPTLDHSGSILETFQGVQSARRIGRAESRSTFTKIDLFRFGDRLLVDFAPPEGSQGRSWAPSERSLDPLVALGVPLGVPKGALGPIWGPFWGALGRSWVTFQPLKAAKTPQGPNWTLFWLDLSWISMIFPNNSTCESACKLACAKV